VTTAFARTALTPRVDLAVTHRLSPISGVVFGVLLGGIAGGLVKSSAGYVAGGAAVGGVLGYALLATKLSAADPPLGGEPEEESGSTDVGGAGSQTELVTRPAMTSGGFASPQISNTGKLSPQGRQLPKKKLVLNNPEPF
jgi:hypothetical protein